VKVARYNYPAQFGDDIDFVLAAMREAILSGRYGLSDDVASFEREFASFLGAQYTRGVNTGTDALQIALAAVGVGRGDEVVTQANTFNATVAAICLLGARPVLVDALPDTYLIDETQLDSVITARTRAVVPVHLFGKPTPMSGILQLCNARGISVVEDAAQAHGATLDGRTVGTFGAAGCFSFHPNKNLASAGDGGAVATNDPELDADVARRRALGQREQNDHGVIGLNSRLHALQAIVLSAKLPKLDAWNAQRRVVAEAYREALGDLPLRFQKTHNDEGHVFHLFQVQSAERDALLRHLRHTGIDAVVRYPTPIHLQAAFTEFGWRRGQFPVSERLAAELLCLPIRPDMLSREVELVTEAVREFFVN
jgi:dTDP-4-amino-4,6-dideoxygalactose transaminase